MPRLPRLRVALVVAILATCASAPASPAQEPPQAPGDRVLSNESTETRWAHTAARGTVRAAPSATARVVGRLRFRTEDNRPEVYLLLRERVDPSGLTWVEVRLPARPNGQTGWVRRPALGRFHLVTTQLVVDRRRLRATLYRGGRAIWRSRVGIGARRSPTPAGRFWIRERLPGPGLGSIYGPVAFGTAAYSRLSDWPRGGVVGIHGTNQPRLIPGRVSHGCVRVRNARIRRLARLMPIGTPVLIR